MKHSRTWLVWAAFALCAATILGAMAWQTRNAIASERERVAAVRQADLQERMRLALWRMDTLGAALLLEEDLGGTADFIHSRFEWKESGQLVQPDGKPASGELQRALTQPGGSFESYFIRIRTTGATWNTPAPPPTPAREEANAAPALKSDEMKQIASNKLELERRSQAIENVASKQRAAPQEKPSTIARKKAKESKSAELADAATDRDTPPPLAEMAPADTSAAAEPPPAAKPTPAPPAAKPSPAALADPTVTVSSTRPIWIGDELFLLRSVSGASRLIQGSWLNLEVLHARFLGEIRDLLPAARLIPARSRSDDGLVLASLPLRLEPGPLPSPATAALAPAVMQSLGTGWAAALLAILAASFLVFGIMRLSERRASFVSAVTHELRTPLTTFRLYSDMLESNAVKPEKRGDYLRVLSREADRLSHLVENVLAFSRIERGSARSAVSSSRLRDLLEPMKERFEARLSTAGMSLHMPLDEPASAEMLRVDATAIEHILFNLVDNAAKYAAGSNTEPLEISISRNRGSVQIRVSDHGPGIPQEEHRRIFRAFHKSAREAAESRPGVGLGLALSRRLARGMGGELICESAPGRGASFILSLPI